MPTVTLARHAMATRFEVLLHGPDATFLRAAGEEALDEIDRLENQLSLYRPESEISRVNALAAREPVRVSPATFGLLRRAADLSRETGGAFDVTVAPLVRCWGFMGGDGKIPNPEELAHARDSVGMNLVELDERNFTVRFLRKGVMIDLGAIGKGYALDRAAEILREAGVTSALLHGGTSTICAIGHPPEAEAWKLAIEPPGPELSGGRTESPVTLFLRDESLSVSAIWGRSFREGGKLYGHVLDPRTFCPVDDTLLAAVVLPSAAESDSLSTALLVIGEKGHAQIAQLRRGIRTLGVAREAAEGGFWHYFGNIEPKGR
jgi:thiamine biosynthesis lipoprotein